ncbi:hypothetical protein FQN57_004980 [Myotisia sp. PD_48]|nr:hypothetical protein FQN57_004980 [Myotisia sp. PD_48]
MAQPIPPLSPRKRRMQLRKSEDGEGVMSIEDYILRTDPYFSTTARPPLLHPYFSYDHPLNIPKDCPLLWEKILNIMRSTPFHGWTCRFRYIRKPGYHGDQAIPMLRMTLNDVGALGAYGRIKDNLKHALISSNLSNVGVEVSDVFKCFSPSFFVVRHQDLVVPLYKQASDSLAALLTRELGNKWRTMSVFRVGQTEDVAKSVITVMVQQSALLSWSDLSTKMIGYIWETAHSQEYVKLEVEFFLAGQPAPAVSFAGRVGPLNEPRMDYSIGIEDEVAGGTLDGFLKLKYENTVHHWILTNYHVVRPANTALLTTMKVQADRKQLTGKEVDLNREYNAHCQQRMAALLPSSPPESLVRAMKANQTKLQSRLRDLSVFNAMPQKLGRVLVSSGKSVDDGRVLDWAFVEISGTQLDQIRRRNELPSQTPSQSASMGLDSDTVQASEVTGFGKIVYEGRYFKQGRTTKVTAGICNGIEAYCNWPDANRCRYDVNGAEVKCVKHYSKEFVNLATSGIGKKIQAPFWLSSVVSLVLILFEVVHPCSQNVVGICQVSILFDQFSDLIGEVVFG